MFNIVFEPINIIRLLMVCPLGEMIQLISNRESYIEESKNRICWYTVDFSSLPVKRTNKETFLPIFNCLIKVAI